MRKSFRVVACVAATACSGGDGSAYARSAESAAPAVIEPMTAPYVAAAVSQPATIVGSVRIAGGVAPDQPVVVTRDPGVCGTTIRQTQIDVRGDRLRGAVVWLSDIRTGKPLPLARRFELVQQRCTFDPMIQAVVAGGTLNVRTDDPVISRSIVVDARTLDTLIVLPFTDAGEVVPLDAQLRRPALLEVRSTTHPWMRAWVAVLDHPYVAQSDSGGAFKFENVPAGTYALRAWHPRVGLSMDTVRVRPNATDSVHILLGARAPEQPAQR